MTPQTVGLAAALALVSVFVLWRLRTRFSPGVLMLAAVPLALVPAAAAVTFAAWRLRWMFEEIGRTGTGGMAAVLVQLEESGALMLAGLAGTLVVLAVAGVLALWMPRHAQLPGRPLRSAAAMLVVCALAGVAAGSAVAYAAERAVFDAAWMSRPLSSGPTPEYPPMATRPDGISIDRLARLVQVSTVGGVALVVGLAAMCFVAGGLATRVAPSRTVTAAAWSMAGALLVAASVHAWRLGGALSWLDDIVK